MADEQFAIEDAKVAEGRAWRVTGDMVPRNRVEGEFAVPMEGDMDKFPTLGLLTEAHPEANFADKLAAALTLLAEQAGARYERLSWPVVIAEAIDGTEDDPETRRAMLEAIGTVLGVRLGEMLTPEHMIERLRGRC